MIRIGMSTSCVFPRPLESAFRTAREAGFDGVEVMVSAEAATRSAASMLGMTRRYELPVLAIHAPVLFFTQFVWGTDQRGKLQRSAELAAEVGAPTVVVHPPFRWQAGYAERFLDIVREIAADTGVEIAVENMFPWRVSGRPLRAYMPGIDPVEMDCDAITLDFSHAALAGQDALEMARAAGERLRHVHLCDGQAPPTPEGREGDGRMFDEHLVPGRGGQPVAETLRHLAGTGWRGSVVAEVNTRRARGEAGRLELLWETLDFARTHLAGAAP
ncbi:MAG: sugar phosphate isomerase/epimerase [Pseudoclavibacter sp.]|nr:sugar phosphate isomerase/epimerase [Pseudoclavibacter sp.]